MRETAFLKEGNNLTNIRGRQHGTRQIDGRKRGRRRRQRKAVDAQQKTKWKNERTSSSCVTLAVWEPLHHCPFPCCKQLGEKPQAMWSVLVVSLLHASIAGSSFPAAGWAPPSWPSNAVWGLCDKKQPPKKTEHQWLERATRTSLSSEYQE